MSKRERPTEHGAFAQRDIKRPKLDQVDEDAPVHVSTARHLQALLLFEQDVAQSLRVIKKFKAFLDSILYPEDEDAVPRQRAILREYLDSQRPRVIDEETVYLLHLVQVWRYADSANSDKLVSGIASLLAQLLKVLSNHIDFRDNGLLLCKTVLQQPQLKLVARGMSASKSKEYVISPCLRLLTEIVSFDGGTLARQLYTKRDLTFDTKVLARNLALRKLQSQEPEDERKRPSVRTTAVRYLLANFKFQDEGAKGDILRHSNVLRALIEGIQLDLPAVIREIMNSLMAHIISDPALPRRNKSYLFNDRNLYSLCQLYRVELPDEQAPEYQKPIIELIHNLMCTICASPEAGLVRPSSWYPLDDDESPLGDIQDSTRLGIDLGLDVLEWYNKFSHSVPIRNTTLAEFILTLRPYAYDLERQLLVAIFEAVPELVAWYYFKISTNFTFAPKLTATWIGYASFVFSTIQLPIPSLRNRMSHLPPPVSLAIESILPQPLTQKVLRQCISSPSDLIKLFAIRIIAIAFLKLKQIVQLFRQYAQTLGSLWDQAADKLVAEFCRRAPLMKDITALYSTLRNATTKNFVQKEAAARLLSLYYEVTPQVALDENFDVSHPLATALQAVEERGDTEEDEMKHMELSHLLKIALWSPAVSWWTKPKGLKFSPFMTLLRLIINTSNPSSAEIKSLIVSIARDSGALQMETTPTALDALIVSLGPCSEFTPGDAAHGFLDDCLQRFIRRPIKYDDDLDLRRLLFLKGGENKRISLLWVTLLEQWPFVEKAHEEAVGEISHWLARFCHLLLETGESKKAIMACVKKPANNHDTSLGHILNHAIESLDSLALRQRLAELLDSEKSVDQDMKDKDKNFAVQIQHPDSQESSQVLDPTLFEPPAEDERHSALTTWTRKDPSNCVEDGDLSALIFCLCSPHLSIRRQAFTALRQFLYTIQSSTYIEKDQIYVLVGELLETAEPIISTIPFPSLVGTWAARAASVLADPTHVLYAKVNEFLNKGPSWRIGKLSLYWTDTILLHPPDDEAEGSYWREVLWLLEWLSDGIRVTGDIEQLRKHAVYERVLTLFMHPALDQGHPGSVVDMLRVPDKPNNVSSLQARVRPLILRIVIRTALVGGSTTLITRAGILAWLKDIGGMRCLGNHEGELLREMEEMILQKCDKERVTEWSAGFLAA